MIKVKYKPIQAEAVTSIFLGCERVIISNRHDIENTTTHPSLKPWKTSVCRTGIPEGSLYPSYSR